MSRARSVGVLLVGVLIAGLHVGLPPGAAFAADPPPVEPEAADFASDVYADPWDFSNAGDVNSDAGTAQNVRVSDGRLQMDVAANEGYDPVSSVPASLAVGRDGAAKSIDTSRYSRLSFRMNVPTSQSDMVGAFYWFSCREMIPSCAGGITFRTAPGERDYDFDLRATSTIGARVPWSGSIVALSLRPAINLASGPRIPVSLDWMRLYQPDAVHPHGAYPPAAYSGFQIEPRPIPVIDSPVPQEGRSLAEAQGRLAWDFRDPAAAVGVTSENSRVIGHDGRGMVAVNANSSGDPQLGLPVVPFDGNRFHWMTFDLSYAGRFDLSGEPGGGKLARLIWSAASTSAPQDSDDIVTYSGANAKEIVADLRRPDLLDQNSRPPRVGWAGQTITSLRFDPNEDPGANEWYLRSLHIREDPSAVGTTTIRFHDAAWIAGTRATVQVGTGAPGTYTTIADGIQVRQGVNEVQFDLGSMPEGSYRVRIVMQHPVGGEAEAYSLTPIAMTRDSAGDPRGGFDLVRRVPGGLQVAGWTFDRDSSQPIDVHLYVDGSFEVGFSTDVARPDVQRAYTGAPGRSGFDRTIAVTPGRRTVCAYGINAGAGGNSLLGCRSIDVTSDPFGSLDALEPVPGGFSAVGWAIDPDTSSPIEAHVYAGVSGNPVLASQPRADVALAFPGYGAGHGYRTDFPRAPGEYTACGWAIAVPTGANQAIGCKSVTVGRTSPMGNLDVAARTGASVKVNGWAIDRDTYAPTAVHVYVDGRGVGTATGRPRADVAGAYPDWGRDRGFETTVSAGPGATVCAWAIDDRGAAPNVLLGCRVV